MLPYLGEFVGTAILILLGNGVVANVVLAHTKGRDSGWIVITFGWAMAVFVAVFCSAPISGAHINPAVTLGLAMYGSFDWAWVPGYICAQVLGAVLGASLVWATYRSHYALTEDPDGVLATFCTAPGIRSTQDNLVSEVLGTFMLVFPVLFIVEPTLVFDDLAGESMTATVGLGTLGALPVALVVFAIGLSLGGTTGYAINPARDLGPRLAHSILPIGNKRDSDWGYAWIPVTGPFLGAALAAGAKVALA